MAKRKITHRVVLGDSLSDRGTLDKRDILGFIPMSYLSGLSSKSPRGRFTNGFLWGDFVAATAIEQLEIDRIRRRNKLNKTANDNADIADAILGNARNLRNRNENAFSLGQDREVLYEGHRFARFYCEGGLTAHDFSKEFTSNPAEEGARLIVATLEQKRQQLFADDIKFGVSSREKKETLIVEWSGANDLITVNGEPTHESVDKAIAARMENLEKLIASGYENFVMMNMPDLSLAPRFQHKDAIAQKNAQECSNYFNTQLAEKCALMKQKYPHTFIDVFDVCSLLRQVHDKPEDYGFDKDKLATPFVETEEFKKNKTDPSDIGKKISPSKGYMFWDDVHPTADMHAWLAVKFAEKYDSVFQYGSPAVRSCQHDDAMRKEVKDVKKRYDLETHTKHHAKPDDIKDIINTIHANAMKMKTSTSEIRKKKGKLLLDLLDDIRSAPYLGQVRRIIAEFQRDEEKQKIVATHHNPIFDKMFFKHTTRSQDDVNALMNAVVKNIQKNDSDAEQEVEADRGCCI